MLILSWNMIVILILFRTWCDWGEKYMTQEEKSLQRGAEWEQWGISPWQATERSDRSGTSQNWNVEQMIRVVLTHQRGLSGSLSCCVQVTMLLWLIYLATAGSRELPVRINISTRLQQALPASSASLLLPGRGEYYKSPGENIRWSNIYSPQSQWEKFFSFK